MPGPDVKIDSYSTDGNGKFTARSMRDTQRANEMQYGPDYIDPLMFKKAEHFVYIFSTLDPRPVKLFRYLPPLIPQLEIRTLSPDKLDKYVLVTKIAHPVNQYIMRENGERYMDSHDARRLAMDIVNPNNLTLDQDRALDAGHVFSDGNDYGRLGLFWSLFPIPRNEEIQKAIDRKEAYYRSRLQRAKMLEMTSPRQLGEYISIDDHIAADYFHEEYSWHKHISKPAFCPNCGESIMPGIAFHTGAVGGFLCIIDWRKTVEAGVRTREQVPIEKRWWTQSSRGEEAQPEAAKTS